MCASCFRTMSGRHTRCASQLAYCRRHCHIYPGNVFLPLYIFRWLANTLSTLYDMNEQEHAHTQYFDIRNMLLLLRLLPPATNWARAFAWNVGTKGKPISHIASSASHFLIRDMSGERMHMCGIGNWVLHIDDMHSGECRQLVQKFCLSNETSLVLKMCQKCILSKILQFSQNAWQCCAAVDCVRVLRIGRGCVMMFAV